MTMRPGFGIATCRLVAISLLLGLALPPAAALSPKTPMDQLIYAQWGEKEGAPSDTWSTVQTADGWIWFGGSHGLTRFDGVSFEHVETQPGAADPSPGVSALLALDTGELVVGYHDGGAAILQNHQFTNYHAGQGLDPVTIFGIEQDLDGRLWLATRTGLKRFEKGRWQSAAADWNVAPGVIEDVARDSVGRLWIMTARGLEYLDRGQTRFKYLQPTCIGGALVRSTDDRMWVWSSDQIERCGLQSELSAPFHSRNWQASANALFDRDGNLWTADDTALLRFAPPRSGSWPGKIPFGRGSPPHESQAPRIVRTFMEDRAGNLWVPGIEDAGMIRDRSVMPVTPAHPGENVPLLAADMVTDSDDVVWMASALASDGRDPLDGLWKYDGNFKRVQPEDIPVAAHVFIDVNHTLWVAGAANLWRYAGGRFVRDLALPVTNTRNFVVAMADDRATGSYWISVRGAGLFLRQGDQWIRNGGIDGLPPEDPSALARAPDDTLWLGYLDGRVLTVTKGKVRQVPLDGLTSLGAISAIDATHRVLVGGNRGLAAAVGSRLRALHPVPAAAFDTVASILHTANGQVWLNTALGAVSISAERLTDANIAADAPIAAHVLGVEDGYPGRGASMQRMGSTMTQTRDGRIWVVGLRGTGWFYPDRLPRDADIPLLIRSITTDSGRQSLDAPINLRPGTSHLTIAYTALNYAHPAQQRFRYRLAGFDRDWTEAGTRREAYYTNLQPGRYRFEVVELHETGKWSETPVFVDFDIAPTFVQTKTFIALCVLAGGVAILLLVRWRVALLTRRERVRLQERMDERIGERERIARELHDTLLQGTQGLIFVVHAALIRMRRGEPIEQTLENALASADGVVVESRERIQDLRTITHLGGRLGEALSALGRDLARDAEVRFEMVVHGSHRDLDTTVADETYQVAREALANAFRHSGAGVIELKLVYDAHRFVTRISDDGRGIGAEALSAGARPGHWGLPGMRERAQRIGATFDIRSSREGGTVIELVIGSGTAYSDLRTATGWRPRWWPRIVPSSDHTKE